MSYNEPASNECEVIYNAAGHEIFHILNCGFE